MNWCKYALLLIFSISISACFEVNSAQVASEDKPTVKLMPLTLSLEDESGNSLPYIDVTKIGSHLNYRLVMTNSNSVAVTAPRVRVNTDWFYYQAYLKNESFEDYIDENNPGYGSTSYIATESDPYACDSVLKSIPPGGFCRYNYFAANYAFNSTQQEVFSYPIDYYIEEVDNPHNYLGVHQCRYYYLNQNPYDCSAASKPGFSRQFITYKMAAINGAAPQLIGSRNISGYSNDGNWLYTCNPQASWPTCASYRLNYNLMTNSLDVESEPTRVFTLGQYSYSGNNRGFLSFPGVFVTPDGSGAWILIYGPYRLINSESPNYIFDGDCVLYAQQRPCVPNINNSSFNGGTMGFDGSMWWTSYNTENSYPADVYRQESGTFFKTNISNAQAVTKDGVVVVVGSCYRESMPNDPTSYVRQPMKNYVEPIDGFPETATSGANIYVKMSKRDMVNWPKAPYYKVHTENGLCEVRLDDYTMVVGASQQWITMWSWLKGLGLVAAPAKDVYFGLVDDEN